MHERITVAVHAADPVSQIGITGELRSQPDFLVVAADEDQGPRVAVVVSDAIDEMAVCAIRALRRRSGTRIVVVAGRLEDRGILDAVEAGACAFLRREEARPDTLAVAVRRAAEGDATMPPDLLGRLLGQVSRAQQHVLGPRGLTLSGLTKRETEVLALLADGHNTAEVARKLIYSERTVKNVLADVTRRLNLRNRTHAVAFAVRQGLI